MDWLIFWGIIVSLTSSFAQSLGLSLQRLYYSHVQQRTRRKKYLGMGLFLGSNILGSAFRIATLPMILLAPLNAATLVFNALLASCLLHEPVCRQTQVGTCFVVLSSLMLSYVVVHHDDYFTAEELFQLLRSRSSQIFFFLQLGLVSLVIAAFAVCLRLREKIGRVYNTTSGLLLGFISGTLSAHCLLCSKIIAITITECVTSGEWDLLERPEPWQLLFLLVVMGPTHLVALTSSLSRLSPSVVYPFTFCTYSCTALVDGLVFLQRRMPPTDLTILFSSTLVLLYGVFLLSTRGEIEENPNAFYGQIITAQAHHLGEPPLLPFMDEIEDEEDTGDDSENGNENVRAENTAVPTGETVSSNA
ncbi:DUF803 domain-containing protein [Schizosaccharomyces japonicus yFS275]|uniref:DUF803 domain-containing protein n=1 Tax=Schizosaccharomyces japonicus (strain yFS275 / FY16936) TaxID=402676 RepID=B6JV11_SCHJY|nr:DUF803 domain-containing protein [Schizosaccharomyces japonicus yFS275]EEB05212.1 DUF803 domain-containing protein [Schizosaccharomyces japonicus yFS275]